MIKRLLLIIICICLFTGTVSAASDEIKALEIEVEVDSGGTCRVNLSIQAQFASTAKEFLIPLGTDAYDINASGAFDTDSREGVEYVVFENNFGFSGSQSFSCSYSLPCTMTEDESGQYFTLQIPENGFALPINRYHITARFPVEITKLPTWKSSYYQEDIDNYLHIKVTDNVVTADSQIAFRDHETMTMELEFQPDSFDLRHLPGQTVGVAKLGFFLLALVCIVYWFLRLRNKALRIHPLQAVNLDSSAGEFPCQIHGMSPDIASLLAHWGNWGYVVLWKNRRGQLCIQKTMEMGNERKAAEQRLFHALFSRSDICEVPSSRFMSAVKQEGEQLKAYWQRRLFLPNSGSPLLLRSGALLGGGFVSVLCSDLMLTGKPSRWIWLVVLSLLGIALCYITQQAVYAFSRRDGMLRLLLGSAAAAVLILTGLYAKCTLLMVGNVALQFFCAFVTRFGGRRSGPGEELLKEILGLRRFLRKASNDVAHRLLTVDSQYFYKMLPYAEMLGLGSAFARRFGEGGSEPCLWLVSERHKPKNALEFYRLYCEIMSELRYGQRFAQKRSLLAGRSNPKRPNPANRNPRRDHTANRSHANRDNATRRRADANRRSTAKRP